MQKEKQAISKTGRYLEFTILLSLFFPVSLEALFNFGSNTPKDASGVVLQSGIIISLLILNYLLLEWRKPYLSILEAGLLMYTYLYIIACYTFIIFYFGLITSEISQVSIWMHWAFVATAASIVHVPMGNVAILLINFFRKQLP